MPPLCHPARRSVRSCSGCPCVPELLSETSVMAPVARSFTKTSITPFVSPATRLSARLSNATLVPSGEKNATKLPSPACSPAAFVETRVTAPVTRSLTKISYWPFVSPVTRLPAMLSNATFVPSGEKTTPSLRPSPCAPDTSVDTRLTAPVKRSLTKMSDAPFVSSPTRLEASLSNATFVPSGEKTRAKLPPLPCAPDASVETRVTAPVNRSLTKMSDAPFVSSATRLEAKLSNATFVPSGEKTGGSCNRCFAHPTRPWKRA